MTNGKSPYKIRIEAKWNGNVKTKNMKNRPKPNLETPEKPELLKMFEKLAKKRVENVKGDESSKF